MALFLEAPGWANIYITTTNSSGMGTISAGRLRSKKGTETEVVWASTLPLLLRLPPAPWKVAVHSLQFEL